MAKPSGKQLLVDARQLVENGKHKQALKILEPYKNHERVKAIYESIQVDAKRRRKRMRNTFIAIGTVLMLMCGALFIYANQLVSNVVGDLDADLVCIYVEHILDGGDADVCADTLRTNYQDELDNCRSRHGKIELAGDDDNRGVWVICLEGQGVNFESL